MPDTRYGILPFSQAASWPELLDVAKRVDQLGYDHLWAWDHLYAIFGDPYQDFFEGYSLLAAWARETKRVRLGLLVGANTFRNPGIRNVTLDLPRDQLIVFTGLSGSGKSSLAFDTIYAEGQRRYVESLSSYARQFLGQMEKPDVDFIEGLSPAISIDQKSTLPEPALDRRHHHRDLRLPARAVRPRRAPALPEVRAADRPADARADRRPGPGAAGGHQVPGAGAGGPRAEGRVREAARRTSPAKGFASRADRRRGPRARPSRSGSPENYKHTIEVVVDRLVRQAGHPAARRGLASRRRSSSPRASPRSPCRRPTAARRSRPSRQTARVHLRRHLVRRAGAPQLLVQLAVRRLPDVRRPRHRSRSTPSSSSPTRTSRSTRAPSRLGRAARLEYWYRRPRGGRRGARLLDSTPRGRSCRRGRGTSSSTARDEEIYVRYKNRYGRQRSYWTTYEGVVPNLERRHARDRLGRRAREARAVHARDPVPRRARGRVCGPRRLAVTVGGLQHLPS